MCIIEITTKLYKMCNKFIILYYLHIYTHTSLKFSNNCALVTYVFGVKLNTLTVIYIDHHTKSVDNGKSAMQTISVH